MSDSEALASFATLLPSDVTAEVRVFLCGSEPRFRGVRWTLIGWEESLIDTYGNAFSIHEAIADMTEMLK